MSVSRAPAARTRHKPLPLLPLVHYQRSTDIKSVIICMRSARSRHHMVDAVYLCGVGVPLHVTDTNGTNSFWLHDSEFDKHQIEITGRQATVSKIKFVKFHLSAKGHATCSIHISFDLASRRHSAAKCEPCVLAIVDLRWNRCTSVVATRMNHVTWTWTHTQA